MAKTASGWASCVRPEALVVPLLLVFEDWLGGWTLATQVVVLGAIVSVGALSFRSSDENCVALSASLPHRFLDFIFASSALGSAVMHQSASAAALAAVGLAALFGPVGWSLRLRAAMATVAVAVFCTEAYSLVPLQSVARAFETLLSPLSLVGTPVGRLGEVLYINGAPLHAGYIGAQLSLLPVLYGCFLELWSWRDLGRAAKALLSTVLANAALVCVSAAGGETSWLLTPTRGTVFVVLGWAFSLIVCPRRTGFKRRPERGAALATYIATALALGAMFLLLRPAAPPEVLTILIDEGHGKWSSTLGTFDTSDYGRDTVYNYVLLARWLERGHRVLPAAALEHIEADVVLLKTPTTFYSVRERSELRSFVAAGGTLVVVGDHTNLFGSSTIINDVLSWSGLRLRLDAVLPSRFGADVAEMRWWAAHPAGRSVPRIELQTSASIEATSLSASCVLLADGVVGEGADYSNDRFFGDLEPSIDDRPGPLCVAALRPFGRGRVVLFGDSTIWANFSFHSGYNRRLLETLILGTPRILARSQAMLLFVTLLVITVALSLRSLGRLSPDWLVLALAGGATLRLFASMVGGLPSTAPVDSAEVGIDLRFSDVTLHADPRTGDHRDLRDYTTYVAWLSRLGFEPTTILKHPYERPAVPVILLGLSWTPPPRTLARMRNYVRAGGRLLVLHDPETSDSEAVRTVLDAFEVELRVRTKAGRLDDAGGPVLGDNLLTLPFDLTSEGRASGEANRLRRTGLGWTLVGVHPLLVDDDGLIVAGERTVGSGRITVFSVSSVLSEFGMGDVWGGKQPTREKLDRYLFAYELTAHALRDPVRSE